MVVEGRQFLGSAWWVSTFPGLAIFATVLGFNLFGDGLRDALDPALRSGSRLEEETSMRHSDRRLAVLVSLALVVGLGLGAPPDAGAAGKDFVIGFLGDATSLNPGDRDGRAVLHRGVADLRQPGRARREART